MQTADTKNEEIAILGFQVERGINAEEKDLRAAREVHYRIIKSRMEQNNRYSSRDCAHSDVCKM